jgi:histidinol phosphatase-like PHP family hydrolase
VIDLHTHTVFSDGVLIPAELIRRAEALGIKGIAITDHGDSSNIDWIVPRIVSIADEMNRILKIRVLPGIEITHVPPELIAGLAKKARLLGARVIVVHGETIVEPVKTGTNRYALDADIDVLAHPGLITRADVIKARDKGIFLEVTSRKGHSLTNGHVAKLAKEVGAKLVMNTDTHEPGDLNDETRAKQVVCGAGLTEDDFYRMQENASKFLDRE